MIKRGLLLGLLGLLMPVLASAGETDAVADRVAESLRQLNPQLQVDSVEPTPVPGLYEVVVGAQVVYFSADGRYMLQGELVDLREQRSLTSERRQQQRLAQLAAVPDEEYLIYPAKGETRHRVVIVTDIDCPFCRRMHNHMEEINAQGIEVRYLQMPRAGVGTASYRKAVAVYCADDPLQAMDRAKAGEEVPEQQCDNPVRKHMELASELGINATPTTIFENGAVHPGYMNARDLRQRAEQEAR